ncbi:MAG: hypothetical protein AAF938_00485 [Myxococcota bacterium]
MRSSLISGPAMTVEDRFTDREVSALVEMCLALQEVDVGELARFVRLPESEVAATPFGLRAVALGASVGAFHVHRELTRVPVFGDDPRVYDTNHDQWQNGVLKTGKYQAFMQDGAASIFDPSHIAKWGPHEMLHRACGYFWREDARDFELYIGAYLGELLPVMLWYNADQFLRMRQTPLSPQPRMEHAYWHPKLSCDFLPATAAHEADPRWRMLDEDTLRMLVNRELHMARTGVSRRLELVEEAMKTGRMRRIRAYGPGHTQDPESDAMAYAVSHRARLRHPALIPVLAGAPHFESLAAYFDHIEGLAQALYFETFDWKARAGAFAHALGGTAAFGETAADARIAREQWHLNHQRALGGDEAAAADGVNGIDLGQLAEGLEQTLPHTFRWLERHGGDWLERFANSDELWQRRPLGVRLADFLESEGLPDAPGLVPPICDLVKVEGALLRAPRDPRVEEIPDADGTHVLASAAFHVVSTQHDVTAMMDDENPVKDARHWLVGRYEGETLTIGIEAELARRWPALQLQAVERSELAEETVALLVEAGALVLWTPPR